MIGGGVSDSDGVKPQKWDFATTASIGVWHHAALTYADNVATFYLDGDVMTSTIAMEELAQVANPLYIGAADATREFFVGYIREVCFVKGPEVEAGAQRVPFKVDPTGMGSAIPGLWGGGGGGGGGHGNPGWWGRGDWGPMSMSPFGFLWISE